MDEQRAKGYIKELLEPVLGEMTDNIYSIYKSVFPKISGLPQEEQKKIVLECVSNITESLSRGIKSVNAEALSKEVEKAMEGVNVG